ncbi:MAG: adenylosuccinate lyase [Kiritimatiellaeota bacterium]|nr:adenylosuccinate lyase [Kiritimatiellota bacterium]
MIERYARPEMAALWTDERKFAVWLEVELLAAEAWAKLGNVPAEAAARMRTNARFTVGRIAQIEAQTHHDVVAFTRCVEESLGEDAAWLHYGLTSTDVVDTALAVNVTQACALLEKGLERLIGIVARQAKAHKATPTMGRTHGVHAEPTAFGLKFVLWHADMKRALARLRSAHEGMRVGKLSGAVGHYGQIDPFVEQYVCERLGLAPAPIATQVLQRDRHAELLCAVAITGGCLEKMATEVRHWQRTELREAEEPFGKGQKGSSTMPHKRNPIKSENICGLARVLRGYAVTAMEDIALWHERDISHSSAERIVIADGLTLLDYMIDRMAFILDGLLVYPENMARSMAMSHGLVYAQRVMLRLVEAGMPRTAAYDTVQRLAMQSWEQGVPYEALLAADPDIARRLSPEALRDCFDPAHSLRHVNVLYERNGLL